MRRGNRRELKKGILTSAARVLCLHSPPPLVPGEREPSRLAKLRDRGSGDVFVFASLRIQPLLVTDLVLAKSPLSLWPFVYERVLALDDGRSGEADSKMDRDCRASFHVQLFQLAPAPHLQFICKKRCRHKT